MKLVHSLAALTFGGILVAGCNPKTDDADPAAVDPATEDETMAPAPASPTDMPPPPPTDTPPADPMTPSPTDPAQEPPPEPPPPPNG
jgi:PBP1b-binding outer membrane lipoprotein LpoB